MPEPLMPEPIIPEPLMELKTSHAHISNWTEPLIPESPLLTNHQCPELFRVYWSTFLINFWMPGLVR